jgi:glycosyltransferase involved in cell wall biosynthesis
MVAFQVSVTMPVYNAASFVQQAVESALAQPQTAEVIIVEDLSTDNSWYVCQQLAAKYERVHVYRHPDGNNHGCSASRSLAIQKSTCEYVAFLDADDFYLPNRFALAEQMFEADPELEGVYEAIGMYVEDEASLQRWKEAGREETTLHTMTKRVPPEELFFTLVTHRAGSFHVNGSVLNRHVFDKIGYFIQDLPLHMDEVFFIKAAALAKLMPGCLDRPVAMWRVHDHNRISAYRPESLIYEMKLKFWYSLWDWSMTHLTPEQQELLLQAMIKEAKFRSRLNRPVPKRFYSLQQRIQLMALPFSYPAVLREPTFWKAFPPDLHHWLDRLQAEPSLKKE